MNRGMAAVVLVVLGCGVLCAEGEKIVGAARFQFPGRQWVMTIDLDGFAVSERSAEPDGTRYMLAGKRGNGNQIIVSVFMEPARRAGDSKMCREFFRGSPDENSRKKYEIQTSEVGDIALVEYVFKLGGSFGIQKHINAYIAKGDVWIDVHISKSNFVEADRAPMLAIVRSIDFPKSLEEYSAGQECYNKEDYAGAAKHLHAALDLEKQDPKFTKVEFRELVVHLGIAYGISGDLKNSKGVLEYGLQKDPTYPLFFYNMACVYAESDDLDNTIVSLRKAFQYKANVRLGGAMPDPRTDSSFRRFMNNEKFRKLLAELGM